MAEKYIVVSGYSKGTPYEKLADDWLVHCKKHVEHYQVVPFENMGWHKNCQKKALIIQDAIRRYNCNVVWVDIDAHILKPLTFFDDCLCDICCYRLTTKIMKDELLTGTIMFSNTMAAKGILERWIHLNGLNTQWDQKNLQFILSKTTGLNIKPLPKEYIKINKAIEQEEILDPVIVHYQASRMLAAVV